MIRTKKLLALGLSVSMIAGLTACGSSGDDAATTDNINSSAQSTEATAEGDNGDSAGDNSETAQNALYNEGETRTIKIGTWYDHYYDSTDADIHADPSVSDEELAQKHFDVVKEVEEKYNVKIEFVNLTFTGAGVHQYIDSCRYTGL